MIKFTFIVCLLLTLGYIKDIYSKSLEDTSKEYEVKDASLNSGSYDEEVNLNTKKDVDSEDISAVDNETIELNSVSEINPVRKSPKMKNENRISKGVNRNITQEYEVNYLFSVSIQRKSSHYTSGALVHRHWVLSSAAEFYNVRESIKIFRARIGSVNCKAGGLLVPFKQVEVHPLYVQSKPAFDVALLKLGVPVDADQLVTPIAISQTKGRIVNAKFLTTYWPRLIVKGSVIPSSAKERFKQYSMRISAQKIISWDDCHRLMESHNVALEPSSQCLEPIKSHHSSCMPDAGAPIFAKDGLWGITSGWTAKRCPKTVSATVFTRLSSPRVHSWLQLLLVDLQ